MESVELEAIKEFGKERVIRIDGLNTHVDKETNLSDDCTRIEKPLLDFHFLQNCDKAVITQQSGFGQLGLWNRRNPYKNVFVYRNNHFMKASESSSFEMEQKWIIFVISLGLFEIVYFLFVHFYSIVNIKVNIFIFLIVVEIIAIFGFFKIELL